MRRCLGRGDWLVVWRGEMAGRLSCAPFLSAHFLVSSRLFSPLLFSSLPSLCSCSSRRACRVAACLASGRGSVAAWRCAWCGGGTAWRVVERAVGGSMMSCRAAWCVVSGTRGGTHGEMKGETIIAPFLSARLGILSDGGGVVDGCGREVCRGCGGGGVIRMSLLFFSCLSYRMRPGEATSPPSRSPSRIGVSFIPSRCASRRGVSSWERRRCLSFFLSLCFVRGHD